MVSHLHPWPIQLINKQMILHSTFVDLCWPLPCVKHWPPFCKHSSTMSLRQRCTVKSSRRSCSWRMHIQIKRCLNFTSQYCRYPFSLSENLSKNKNKESVYEKIHCGAEKSLERCTPDCIQKQGRNCNFRSLSSLIPWMVVPDMASFLLCQNSGIVGMAVQLCAYQRRQSDLFHAVFMAWRHVRDSEEKLQHKV